MRVVTYDERVPLPENLPGWLESLITSELFEVEGSIPTSTTFYLLKTKLELHQCAAAEPHTNAVAAQPQQKCSYEYFGTILLNFIFRDHHHGSGIDSYRCLFHDFWLTTTACWAMDPEKRPLFPHICQIISGHIKYRSTDNMPLQSISELETGENEFFF